MFQPDEAAKTNPAQHGHLPVMLKEVVEILAPKDGETYLDCTFGGGGHTRAILERANCRVVAIDRDPEAAKRAEAFRVQYGDRFAFEPVNFSKLDKLQNEGYAGVLFDFGVSSFQLDDAERGFSIMREGPLDMRMNFEEGESALEFIKNTDEFSLCKILREYGEEPRPRKVARAIIDARDAGKISTTKDLAEAVAQAVPTRERIHPATRAFQAIRIKINNELGEIEDALPKAFERLAEGGIMVAISFHSLEDRIVKRFFKKMAGLPESRFDRSFSQDRVRLAELLTRKPIEPSEEECSRNPRSRSAKLRAIRKESVK